MCTHSTSFFLNSKFVKKLKKPEWYLKKDVDPLFEILKIYDMILGDYFSLNHEIILATGLSQSPSDNPIFYYRLKDHSKFLKYFMIEFKNVYPRMTRDFLIEFEDNEKKDKALNILQNIMLNKKNKIFNQIEIREKSLFVTLDYSNEIQKKMKYFMKLKKLIFLIV